MKYSLYTYLIPSYLIHSGKFACEPASKQALSAYDRHEQYRGGRKICYHPAIKIGPYQGGETMWSSDYCCGKLRSEAVNYAAAELARVRQNRCWPKHWRRPPGGDPEFLFSQPQLTNGKILKAEELTRNITKVKLARFSTSKKQDRLNQEILNKVLDEKLREEMKAGTAEQQAEAIDPEDQRDAEFLSSSLHRLLRGEKNTSKQLVESSEPEDPERFDPGMLFDTTGIGAASAQPPAEPELDFSHPSPGKGFKKA